MQNRKIRKQASKILNNMPFVELVKEGERIYLYDTLLDEVSNRIGIILRFAYSNELLQGMPFKIIWNESSWDTINKIIENTYKIELFRQYVIKSKKYDFDIKLQRVNSKNQDDKLDMPLSFARCNVGDMLILTVNNTGTDSVRFDIVDIEPNNRASKPDARSTPKICYQLVPPGGEISIPMGPVSPPYGLEQLKIIAAPQCLDFGPILNFGKNLSQTRGSEPGNALLEIDSNSEVNLCVKNIYFEICSSYNN
jgi:hypothetical protein